MASRALGCRIDGVCGVGDYLTQTYLRESPRADMDPKKVNNLVPMAPRPLSKGNLLVSESF